MVALLSEAQSLQGRKRYVDALAKLEEAEMVDPQRPEIYNIRGAIYLAAPVRDLGKAREQFTQATALKGDEMPPWFNLAEVEFVGGKWPACEKAFGDLLTKFPKLPTSVRHLVLFKMLVAKVKQDKLGEAEQMITDNFTFMDDTPAYYFAQAALEFHKDDKVKGQEWVTKVNQIFKNGENVPYLDTLMEAHWIPSLSVPDEPGK